MGVKWGAIQLFNYTNRRIIQDPRTRMPSPLEPGMCVPAGNKIISHKENRPLLRQLSMLLYLDQTTDMNDFHIQLRRRQKVNEAFVLLVFDQGLWLCLAILGTWRVLSYHYLRTRKMFTMETCIFSPLATVRKRFAIQCVSVIGQVQSQEDRKIGQMTSKNYEVE